MGQQDVTLKEYLSDPERFADAFNGGLFRGKRIIDPSRLRELDPSEIHLSPAGKGTKARHRKAVTGKVRDLLKQATLMADDRHAYLILGIENQKKVDYAMPVRAMVYDALRYDRQLRGIRRKNRKSGNVKGAEYISGFQKTDCLLPVITLVMYYSPDAWDGAKSLHEMFGSCDSEILEHVADYKINLMEPGNITEEELNHYTTGLRSVIKYVKYSNDLEKLREALNEDTSYQELDEATAEAIEAVSGKDLNFKPEGGVVNMCKALDDLEKNAKAEGDDKRRRSMAKNLYEQGVSISIIANAAEATDETVRQWLGLQPA